ncbi:DUF6338 family protein [Streptomyces sp. NPDC085612]|uniref:DUF6338 family protein n=1 Tax=Streptomyces sp. NPDC085612 TaxID=3365732 RepID=UPI0037D081D6
MPGSVVGAVLLLVALTPGYVYHQALRRYSARDTRTTTAEVVELFGVGALTTTTGLLLTLLLAELAPFLVPLSKIVHAPADFPARPWSWVATGLLALAVSFLLSASAGVLAGRRSPRRVGAGLREGTPALWAFTDRAPEDPARKAFLAVELSDGRLVEGYVRYVSSDPDPERRDLVLQRPIAWTGPGATPRTPSQARFVFVPGALVSVVHISYPAPARQAQSVPPQVPAPQAGPAV